MAHCYYDSTFTSAPVGAVVELTGDDARHAIKVARMRVGERFLLGDGEGLLAEVEATEVLADRVRATVQSEPQLTRPAGPRLLLAQALAKGGRDELAIQTACELGVDAVLPWQAERSVVKWVGPKAEKQQARWQGIVREAAKQSLRARVPEVTGAVTSRELAALADTGTRLIVLDPRGDVPLHEVDLEVPEVLLAVGPEGGISETEFQRFEHAGAVRVRLGNEVLRTSSAGPAALAVLQYRLGRW